MATEGLSPAFFAGLAARSQTTDCPLGAFRVEVSWCSGAGECASVCEVGVFTTDAGGRCTVVHDELCFGCMACVSQCAENGVSVSPSDASGFPGVVDLLR